MMPETKNHRILIMIPAYNEAASIRRVITEIRSSHPHLDIVVIDDGSKDSTREEAEAAGAWVAVNPFNLGIGGAVQTGYKIAFAENYDIAVQIDGDAQHDPASLEDLLKPILENRLDLVIGSRFLSRRSLFHSTPLRRIGIRFFASLLSFFTGVHLTDPTSGYRATGKKLIARFAEYYPSDFPEPEAIQIAKRYQGRIGEVPVKMRERFGGVSSIRYLKTAYYMIKVTVAILIDTLKTKD